MQRKDLALRVLSTAAIMSIVTSIAAPAFAGTYYLGDFKESEFRVEVNDKGEVKVNGTVDTTDVVIRGGKEADYAAPAPATGNAEGSSATAATQELEASGSADAAGESQPDPDAGFTLNETGEDSAQNQEGNNPTENPTEDTKDNPTENPKKDVVYEYAPADPEPEKPTTKLAPTTSVNPAAETREATLADAPAPTTPAAGSVTTPTTSVIKVINNWVNNVLNIRLDNVNIKSSTDAAMTVSGNGNTKIELDGKNTLDSSGALRKAGLNKQGNNGTMTITADTADSDKLTVKGGNGAAGIESNNITVEGNATVEAEGGKDYIGTNYGDWADGRAGIQGGNITIRGDAKVKAKSNSTHAAAIGGGNIEISGNAKVEAEGVEPKLGFGAAVIGTGYFNGSYNGKTSVTIGTAGATSETEHTEVIVKGGGYAGIGGGSAKYASGSTNVTIQGGATVDCQGDQSMSIGGMGGETTIEVKDDAHIKNAKGIIGGTGEFDLSHDRVNGTVNVTIKDNAQIDKAGFIGGQRAKSASVTITGNAKIGEVTTIGADDVAYSHMKILENAVIEKMYGRIGDLPNYSGLKEADVTVDGGETGKVKINENTSGHGWICGKNLTFGNNVLIKLGATSATDPSPVYYVPDDTVHDKIKNNKSAEIWYTNTDGTLYKIIHSEDLCKEGSTPDITKQPTCTEPGSANYTCDYEHTKGATDPNCHRTWTGEVAALGHNYQKTSTVAPTCVAQGYDVYTCTNDPSHTEKRNYTSPTGQHTWGEWKVKTPATCDGEGEEHRTCSMCHKEETRKTAALGHQWKEDHRTGNCGVAGDIYYVCERDSNHTKTEHVDATGNHNFNDWHQTKAPTCLEKGEEKRECSVCGKTETREVNKLDHVEELRGAKEPTCTEPGYTGDKWCTRGDHLLEKGSVIPATGHHWKDNGDGTHTCPDCGATEGQPFNTNSALELRVVDAEGVDQPFTVSQNGTLRTYTGAYDTATLTGDLDTLRYLQDHGAQTIQFVTNGQTSSFAINDLLAQGSGSEVFYLTHRGAEEPTLLLVEADHSELVKD